MFLHMRASRKDVQVAFERFLNAGNLREAGTSTDTGGYLIDQDVSGYQIQKAVSSSGAVEIPFGIRRRTAGEMVDALNIMEDTTKELRLTESKASMNSTRAVNTSKERLAKHYYDLTLTPLQGVKERDVAELQNIVKKAGLNYRKRKQKVPL